MTKRRSCDMFSFQAIFQLKLFLIHIIFYGIMLQLLLNIIFPLYSFLVIILWSNSGPDSSNSSKESDNDQINRLNKHKAGQFECLYLIISNTSSNNNNNSGHNRHIPDIIKWCKFINLSNFIKKIISLKNITK